MKRALKLLFILVVLFGCSSNKVKVDDINVSDLTETIRAYEELGMAFPNDVEMLKQEFEDFNEDEVSEFAYLAGANVQATRIVVFEVKDKKNLEKYTNMAIAIRDNVIKSFEQYLQNAHEVAKNSHIETRGNYVIFIAHHNEADIWGIVDTFIPNESAKIVEISE